MRGDKPYKSCIMLLYKQCMHYWSSLILGTWWLQLKWRHYPQLHIDVPPVPGSSIYMLLWDPIRKRLEKIYAWRISLELVTFKINSPLPLHNFCYSGREHNGDFSCRSSFLYKHWTGKFLDQKGCHPRGSRIKKLSTYAVYKYSDMILY